MKLSRKEFLTLSGLAGTSLLLQGCDPLVRDVKNEQTTGPSITFKKIKLNLAHTWTISRGSADYKEDVIVEYCKDGITGIGEASHMTGAGQNADRTIEELKKLIPIYQEADPFEFYDLPGKANEVIPGVSPVKAAIDIALFDWIGKKLGIPIHRYLGLNPEKHVNTSFSIGYDKPEILKKKVREAEPYKILKVKLTNRNDEQIIKTIRSLTDKPVRVDINEGWTNKEEAIRKIEWLAGQGVNLVEQPMPVSMIEETKWLKERSTLPIIADEAVNTSKDIMSIAEAYDGINIKLMKSGGIMEAYRMAIIASAGKLDIMIGCMIASSVAITAAVQLQPLARWLDLDGSLLISNDPFRGALFNNGHWVMPEGPGIGVEKTSDNKNY
ncbi:MAG TPA: dipeptide epimerase [Bacteroidales bacterium]|nr:dipeptide epimerase [Bacteroidales bacterium]